MLLSTQFLFFQIRYIPWPPDVIHMCLCHLGYHAQLQRSLSHLPLTLPSLSLDHLTLHEVVSLQQDLFYHLLRYLNLIDPLVPQEVSYFDRLPSNLMTIIRLHLLLLYLH